MFVCLLGFTLGAESDISARLMNEFSDYLSRELYGGQWECFNVVVVVAASKWKCNKSHRNDKDGNNRDTQGLIEFPMDSMIPPASEPLLQFFPLRI